MKRQRGLAWLLLGSLLLLIPIIAFLKTSASNLKSRPVAPGLARLGKRATVHAAGRGAPRINFADGREVLTAYDGDPALQQLLEQNLAQPLAMASGDFDEDGAPDLISAYSGPSSGVLTLHRGNVDAIYPNATDANYRKAQGTFTDAPFLSPASLLALPVSPDFIGAGDFDADGHSDLAAAARGGSQLYLLAGNGKGGFGSPELIELPGAITAMATGEINRRDGLADLIVGIISPAGPQVLIFQNAKGALRAPPESFALPDAASDFAIGRFDNDASPDLAIAAGHDLMVIHGRDRDAFANAATPEAQRTIPTRQSFPFTLKSLASGNFGGTPQDNLAALCGNGAAYLLSASSKKQGAEPSQKNLRWKTKILAQGPWSGSARLLKANVSNMPQDDLLVVDSSNRQLHIIETGNREPGGKQAASSSSGLGTLVDFEVEDEPVAALPMRLNADAINDLVILRKHNFAPSAVSTQSAMIFAVVNNADNGMGSLRQAIIDANTNPGADTIIFMIGSGPQTINLTSPLPAITEAVTIDGMSQPGFAGVPLIELNGDGVPAGGTGLSIFAGNCAVRALVINRFKDNIGAGGNGILIQTGGNNVLEGNFIGTNAAGSAPLGNFIGVAISNSPGNTVGGLLTTSRNVISGNIADGVLINNALAPPPLPSGKLLSNIADGVLTISAATDNQIRGNFIGTNAAGTVGLGNGNEGVRLEGVANNTVGGTTVAARNVISGNSDQGILARISATGNLVQGNFIGTNATGTAAIANAQGGIFVQDSTNNTVGGTAAGAGNLLSGNTVDGILIAAGSGNTVQGNRIGTNAAGTGAIPNGRGVRISTSTGNAIGGTAAGARNIISGNNDVGVLLTAATDNHIQGNIIGADITGTVALGNFRGIALDNASGNLIGGTTAAARNIISGNATNALSLGISIAGGGSSGNLVQGNFIGTDSTGAVALPNPGGVLIDNAPGNTIGGTAAGAGNLISGNTGAGLVIQASGAKNNSVQGNLIGTNPAGTAALGNFQGVAIVDAPGNTIGGTAAGARNIISGNNNVGLVITNPAATDNLVQGNFIGTDVTGTVALGNALEGIGIGNAANNTIGGTAAAARNVISANGESGIEILTTAANNLVQGNFIGTNVNGTVDLGNTNSGVRIADSFNNTIGGTSAGARNIISGNGQAGVFIENTSPGTGSANLIQGNFIGTDVTGTIDLGNDSAGIGISAVPGNIIGGAPAGARNIISGNNGNGINIFGIDATGNQVQGNFIGTNASGGAALANSQIGVSLSGGSSNNIIGGIGAGNIIAFNGAGGVGISSGAGNAVLSNSIFSNTGSGINLNDDGGIITPNDNCDADSGANNLQNFPVLTSATSSPGNTTIEGTLNSTPATTFRIEFFSNAVCDPSGNGEGQTFIGATTIPAAGVCDSPFNVSLPVTVAVGSSITATATDASNNTSEFSACVTVVAGVGPCTLNCPPNLIASVPNSASCAAVVNYAPTTAGGCGAVSCEPPSGSPFPIGGTKVTCTVAGGSGPSCAFSVTVLDPFAPIIVCPASLSRPATPGQSSTVVNYPAPAVTDNCGTPSVQCTPASGTGFLVGTTTVRCTATDSSGNRGNCSFDITVLDSEAPVIKCPPNVSVAPPSGQSSAVVSYPAPTATDNLPGVSVVCSPASGSSFPLGTTTVTCTATDSGGNKASCSFTVGVGGPELKVIIPGNKTAVEFASVPPARKAPKPKKNPCSSFTLQNIGFGPLVLTFDSIKRTGSDFNSGRIIDPNDSRFFTVSLVNSDQSLTQLEIGAVLTLQSGQSQILCVKFAALIPAPAGKTTNLAASNVLPDTITSTINFKQTIGTNLSLINTIPVLARVSTGVILIDPVNPRIPPVVSFVRSGNDITVSYAVFDSNLDVSRAKYEFLDASGQVVAGPFEVDLTEPLRSLGLVKGQSFSVEQRFTGASSNSAITGVRVTVFDGESSTVGASSTASAGSPSASSIQSTKLTRGVTLYLPDLRLGPQLP